MTVSFSADDYPHLVKDVQFKSLLQALSVFTQMDGREYRPIVSLSLWLNYQISHTAIPFHYTNLLLHLGNVICLYLIFFQLVSSKIQAATASLVFALHPIHSSNIFFVMGRTDLVCTFFYLQAVLFFILYLTQKRRLFYVLAFVFFILGLLSKEMAVSLPILLFAMSLLVNEGGLKRKVFTALRQMSLFLLLLSVYIVIRVYFWSINPDSIAVYVNYYFPGMIRNLAMWFVGLAYPFNLYQLRDLLETNPVQLAFYGLAYSLMLIVVLGLVLGKNIGNFFKDRIFIMSIIWFAITLLPIIGGHAHRWYLYLPSVSMSLLILALWRSCQTEKFFYLVLFLSLFLFSLELYKQSVIWSRQSQISQKFLNQIELLGLNQKMTYYFANVPFGYKSAFLFSYKSLEDAIYLRTGHKPEISILSYVNLRDEMQLSIEPIEEKVRISIEPDMYGFFLFPPTQRKFTEPDIALNVDGALVTINKLAASHTAASYDIGRPKNGRPKDKQKPLYYFDGKGISQLY